MAELELEEPGEISHTSAEPFIRPDQVGVTVIGNAAHDCNKLDGIAKHATPMQSTQLARYGITRMVLSWRYISRRIQRRRHRDQANANEERVDPPQQSLPLR